MAPWTQVILVDMGPPGFNETEFSALVSTIKSTAFPSTFRVTLGSGRDSEPPVSHCCCLLPRPQEALRQRGPVCVPVSLQHLEMFGWSGTCCSQDFFQVLSMLLLLLFQDLGQAAFLLSISFLSSVISPFFLSSVPLSPSYCKPFSPLPLIL